MCPGCSKILLFQNDDEFSLHLQCSGELFVGLPDLYLNSSPVGRTLDLIAGFLSTSVRHFKSSHSS